VRLALDLDILDKSAADDHCYLWNVCHRYLRR
jgi:hypothetical protein